MYRLATLFTAAFIMLVSPSLLAQGWLADGEGKIVYPSGRTETLNFDFAYEKSFDTYVFKAGQATMQTQQVPPNYSLNAVVNSEGNIYIAEFASGFFESFELNIGGHYVAIKLRREFDPEAPKKHLVVLIDDMSYLLDTTHPAIRFNFDDNGISDIDGIGLIRDLTSRRR